MSSFSPTRKGCSSLSWPAKNRIRLLQKIIVREEGLAATLVLPPSKKQLPAVILLSGSRGGLSEARAELIASCGYAALALAYFNAEGLPKTLKEIPLEYFETALRWLKSRHEVDPERIGLWGVSRGGELSLLLGSAFPDEFQAIAAYVPSSVVYGAFDETDSPAWTYEGAAVLPNAPCPLKFDSSSGSVPEQAIPLTPCFLKGMEDGAAFGQAAIPVEKIECPILLVSGEDDRMWPSQLYCRQIAERLEAKGSSQRCIHLSYPGAGHALAPNQKPMAGSADFHPAAKLWFDLGGNPKDDAFARDDAWNKTLQFFQMHL